MALTNSLYGFREWHDAISQ